MTAKQPAPVDLEKLKREVLEAAMDALNSETLDGKYGVGIEYAIDHLHERGLLAPPPIEGWQPIETAPTSDGLLLLCEGGVFIAPWPSGRELSRQERKQIIKDFGDWPDHKKWTPTHWMPLPQPPQRKEKY